MIRDLRAAALAACVVLSAACDRGAAGTASDEDRDRLAACDVITADEVGDALGGMARRPAATDDEGADALAGRSGCAWSTTDGRSAALFELVRTEDISSSVRRTGFSAAARFSGARTRHPDGETEEIGDRSFWVDEMATLYVLVEDDYLVIEVATPEPDEARAVALRLAAPAVVRLRSATQAD